LLDEMRNYKVFPFLLLGCKQKFVYSVTAAESAELCWTAVKKGENNSTPTHGIEHTEKNLKQDIYQRRSYAAHKQGS
jgi:hypothetical protein